MTHTQKKYKWHKTNKIIEEINNEVSVNCLKKDNHLINDQILKSNLIIKKIKIRNLYKLKGHLWMRVSCGKTIEQNTWLISFEMEKDKIKYTKKLKYLFKLGIDYENILYGLIQTLLDLIKISAKNKDYQSIRDSFEALTTAFKKLSTSNLYLDKITDILRNINWSLEDLILLKDDRINYLVKGFIKAFILFSINDNNSSVFDKTVKIAYRKDFLELDSKEMINKGFIYDVFEIFERIRDHSTDEELIFTKAIIKRLFKIAVEFNEDEIKIIKKEIEDKTYLYNYTQFMDHTYLYGIFIVYISFLEESDRFMDVTPSPELNICINAIENDIFEPDDKISDYLIKLKAIIYEAN